jgi:membrane protein DedA with SNARE-associated domain
LLAILGLVLLEDFGVPVPGETVLILGAVYAGSGRLSIVLVVLFAFCAAVIGDNIGFAIGHFGGRRFAERWGRYVLLTPGRLDTATAFFDRHGGKVITIARFVEGLRQANGIIAGTTGMRWRRFLFYNAIGAALWVGLWASIGYFSGDHIDAIYGAVTHYAAYVPVVAGVVLAMYVSRRVVHAHRASAPSKATDGADLYG